MKNKTEINASKCKRVPISLITSIEGKDLVFINKNYWWIVDKNENVLFFRDRSPQCNVNEKIAEHIRSSLYPDYSIQKIEIAFIPIKSFDYDYDIRTNSR